MGSQYFRANPKPFLANPSPSPVQQLLILLIFPSDSPFSCRFMARIFALLSVLLVGFPAIYAQDISNNFNPNIGTPCFSVLGTEVTHRTNPVGGYIYEGAGSLSMESCCGGSETPAYFISPIPRSGRFVPKKVQESSIRSGK